MTEPQDQGQPTPESSQTEAEKTLTQAEANRIIGQRARQAREAALGELLGKAEGAQSVDDLISAWQEKQQLEQAAQTEAERLQGELQKIQAERDQAHQLANQRLVSSEMYTALVQAGVPSDRIQAVSKLVDASQVSVNNGKVEGLGDAISQTLETNPWVMGAAPEETRAVNSPQVGPPSANSSDPQAGLANFLRGVLVQE